MTAWDPAKHPRGEGGRFGNTVGGQRLKAAGVGLGDKIVAKSKRVRRHKGNQTVDDYARSHPKGRAHALRELAADHKAGKIGFVAELEQVAEAELSTGAQLVPTYVAPDRSKLSSVTGDLKPTDYLTRTNDSKKYPPGITVGDFLRTHPKGPKYAARVLKTDMSYGRVIAERPTADIPRRPRASASAPTGKPPASTKPSATGQGHQDFAFGAGVSESFKTDVSQAWEAIPAKARDRLKQFGATCHAPKRLIDTAPELADEHPRGWPEGATWKEVGGAYQHGASKRLIVAETSLRQKTGEWVLEGRAKSVLMHEAGHAIDAARGHASMMGGFKMAYGRDVQKYLTEGGETDDYRYKYFLQPGSAGRSEMFAEMFADRMGHPTNPRNPPLSERFPECAAWMDEMIKGYS